MKISISVLILALWTGASFAANIGEERKGDLTYAERMEHRGYERMQRQMDRTRERTERAERERSERDRDYRERD
jgi:hypothetical protein